MSNHCKIRAVKLFIFFSFIFIFKCGMCFSQASKIEDTTNIMEGAIDFHVHSSPDITPRSLNDFEAAEAAQRMHFKAIVIKSHAGSTVARAVLVNLKTEKTRVFGGIVLNKAMGGINPDAVAVMRRMSPQYGKTVWFPTTDAAFYKQQNHQPGDGLTILKNDQLNLETKAVLAIIAKDSLVLATGHLSPKEIMLLVPEAKKLGVNKILITHPMGKVPALSLSQMNELAKMGAMLELTYLSVLHEPISTGKEKNLTMEDMVEAIKKIGAAHFIISSDLGQMGNPLPADGLKIFIQKFIEKGISTTDIKLMVKTNPSILLGIE